MFLFHNYFQRLRSVLSLCFEIEGDAFDAFVLWEIVSAVGTLQGVLAVVGIDEE